MLSAENLSFLVIIGMNLLATVLVWAEYSSNRYQYLKNVAIFQTFALLWFLVGLWITFDSFTPLATTLSSIAVFWTGMYLLAASLYKSSPGNAWILPIGTGYSLIVLSGLFISWPIVALSWNLVFLLFLAAPIATVLSFTFRSRWLVASLQLISAILLILSITFLGSDNNGLVGIGAFIYFVLSIVIPLLSLTYIITSVRLSRLEIARQERDYRVFFDSVKEVFYRSDIKGNILAVSPSISQFGVTAEQMVGDKLANHLDKPRAFQKSMMDAMETMTPFEYRGTFRSGSQETDCEIISTPISNDGDGYYFTGSIRNVHERNQMEKELINAQRYESLGVMAGGVAHDFNNILQGIVGRAELLYDMEDDDPEDRRRHLDAILAATASAGNLCGQLLLYTGKDLKEERNFDLAATIREMIEILRTSHSSNIEIDLSLPEQPVLMHGTQSQVGQIFLNLVKNAMEAVGSSGRISVALETRFIDTATAVELGLPANLAQSNYILATVEDSGGGIDPQLREKIFEPFFSTKTAGRGLGLAAISGILRAHGGAISLDSEPGNGARFTVALPALIDGDVEPSQPARTGRHAKLRILLAEDDKSIREIASTILTRAGHQVTQADDGLQALDIFEKNNQEFDLLITDIRMPGMDGLALAQRIKELEPTMPVILATGYADISENLAGYESKGFHFIRKPFRASALLGSIEAAYRKRKRYAPSGAD